MAKQTKSSNNKQSSKANRTTKSNNRSKPMSPKAGVTMRRSRYEKGGKIHK